MKRSNSLNTCNGDEKKSKKFNNMSMSRENHNTHATATKKLKNTQETQEQVDKQNNVEPSFEKKHKAYVQMYLYGERTIRWRGSVLNAEQLCDVVCSFSFGALMTLHAVATVTRGRCQISEDTRALPLELPPYSRARGTVRSLTSECTNSNIQLARQKLHYTIFGDYLPNYITFLVPEKITLHDSASAFLHFFFTIRFYCQGPGHSAAQRTSSH